MLTPERLQSIRPESASLLAAFGLGSVTTRIIQIVKLPELPDLHPASIILITGNSGSGKTSLLPLIIDAWPKPNTLARGLADRSKPLIDCWPECPAQNVAKLNTVGLGDAVLWCRTYEELSDGQKARFDAADLIYGSPGIVVIDEFLTKLDPITAKAVAWSIGNLAHRMGVGCIFISPTPNIVPDLGPDTHIEVGLDPKPHVQASGWDRPSCSLHDSAHYRQGTREDWNQLKHLHYAAGDPATTHSCHAIGLKGLDHPAAVMIFSYPNLHSAPRNLALKDHFKLRSGTDAARLLNQEMLLLSRIVVAPEVRTCGFAHLLIAEAVKRTDIKWLECSTAMGRYNRFLLKIGFQEIPQALHQVECEWIDYCVQVDLDGRDALDPGRLASAIDRQSVRNQRRGRAIIWSLYHHFVLHKRTRARRPARVADAKDPRWELAFDLAARRMTDRPAYFLLDCSAVRRGPDHRHVD